ncbi:hypothetical protein CVT91_08865 [Candidatus Atribacteria bacterium HGW-Atribacteria-1]|nr:MAG: hypothetical protein CVT91_08865 [Candidatus Atribacteria bacterium HGW-Atribacteria-1]
MVLEQIAKKLKLEKRLFKEIINFTKFSELKDNVKGYEELKVVWRDFLTKFRSFLSFRDS